jgi:hypothetical protein
MSQQQVGCEPCLLEKSAAEEPHVSRGHPRSSAVYRNWARNGPTGDSPLYTSGREFNITAGTVRVCAGKVTPDAPDLVSFGTEANFVPARLGLPTAAHETAICNCGLQLWSGGTPCSEVDTGCESEDSVPTPVATCYVFTLLADFNFTLEQTTMFLGNQSNFFITTPVESAYCFTVIPTIYSF